LAPTTPPVSFRCATPATSNLPTASSCPTWNPASMRPSDPLRGSGVRTWPTGPIVGIGAPLLARPPEPGSWLLSPSRTPEVHARFRGIFENYFGQAMREYGLDETQFPLKVIVAGVTSFQLGLIVEGLSNVSEGQAKLLDWIQNWVDSLEAARSR